MIWSLFVPLLMGALGVLQNTINKKVADSIGLSLALLVNSFVLLAMGLILLLVGFYSNALPELFRSKLSFDVLQWKYMVPGFFGFTIIATLPIAIQRAGATKVFIGIIVGQILVSLLWDYAVDSIPVHPLKLAGAFLALVGAVIASYG